MPAELSAVLTFLAVVGFGLALLREMKSLSRPLAEQLAKYRDALTLISARADKADALAKTALESLGNFERAVGDKRSLESAVKSLTEQVSYLQERLTEMQRAVVGLVNPKLEATLTGQTNRAKEDPEDPYSPPPTRWSAANGDTKLPEPLVAELTRMNPSTTYKFRGADLTMMAARESGFPPESA